MKVIFIVILGSLVTKSFSQTGSLVYNALYLTEVKSKFKVNFTSTDPITKEDSILNEFSEMFLKKMERNDLVLIIKDSVRIMNDTTYVKSYTESNYIESVNTQIKVNIRASERILYKGKFLMKNDTTNKYQPMSGDYEPFIFLKNDSTILGYKTSIFQNESGTIKIWVNKKLPKELNPSIKISNPVGGILKYEIIKNDQVITSTIKNLSKSELHN